MIYLLVTYNLNENNPPSQALIKVYSTDIIMTSEFIYNFCKLLSKCAPVALMKQKLKLHKLVKCIMQNKPYFIPMFTFSTKYYHLTFKCF